MLTALHSNELKLNWIGFVGFVESFETNKSKCHKFYKLDFPFVAHLNLHISKPQKSKRAKHTTDFPRRTVAGVHRTPPPSIRTGFHSCTSASLFPPRQNAKSTSTENRQHNARWSSFRTNIAAQTAPIRSFPYPLSFSRWSASLSSSSIQRARPAPPASPARLSTPRSTVRPQTTVAARTHRPSSLASSLRPPTRRTFSAPKSRERRRSPRSPPEATCRS